MKKIFLLAIFAAFPCQVFAQNFAQSEEIKPGILKQLTEENFDLESSTKKNSSKNLGKFNPKFINRLVYDINLNDEYQSTDINKEFINAGSQGRLFSSLQFYQNFSLNSFLKVQSMRQNFTGKNQLFKNEGIFAEELNLVYDNKKYAVVAGKFDLNFGNAWRWSRGIWTYELAQNYQQREKLGFNGIYRVGNAKKTGQYVFGLAGFTNDRKNFDNSLITSRVSESKSDAKAGDTRSLQSYLFSTDVNFDFGEQEKLSYHFSYVNLAVNQRASILTPSKISDQKGYSLGMNYKYPVVQNFALDGLLEYVKMKNLSGNSDISENYFVGNVIGKLYQNWNVTLGYSERNQSQVSAYGFKQNLAEVSFGYEFDKNAFFDKLLFQIGYKNQRDDYKTSLESRNILGVLMRYQKSF